MRDRRYAPPTLDTLFERFGSRYRWYVTTTVMLGTFSVILASTIINVAVPAIMQEFAVAQDQVHWLATGFLAAMTVGMLLNAWAVSRFGSRGAFAIAMTCFIAASIVGGSSTQFGVLVAARVLQGLMAGMIQPHALVAVFQVFPVARRGQAMGIYGMGVVLGPAIAPALGGILVDAVSWRATFFVVIPACLLATGMAWCFLPGRHRRNTPRPDLPGLVLLSATLVTSLWALASVHRRGLTDPVLWAALTGGALLAALFVGWQRRADNPLFEFAVFREPGFGASFLLSMAMGAGLFASTYLTPLYFQQVAGMSASAAGLTLVPAGLAMAFIFPIAGHLTDRAPVARVIAAGMLLFVASLVLLCLAGPTTAGLWLILWSALGRLGIGLMMPPVTTAGLSLLGPALLDRGSGIINFARQIGGAIGINLCAVIAQYASDFHAMGPGYRVESVDAFEAGFDSAFAALALAFVLAAWALYRMQAALRVQGAHSAGH
ncbi:DHA2 family efflux MFS transporter permease subunit [Salinisphaera sp. T31B1]|uniref:DHA2 family efflux MFS transporter permease subunit n=1 Tax=Salinisphaera sp. T31B1 TaxID=727963 RepID=UPI0033422AF8